MDIPAFDPKLSSAKDCDPMQSENHFITFRRRIPKPIRCIYCREPLRPPKKGKGEHIILSALGGQRCILDVCATCNTVVLNKIDTEFLQSSVIALFRIFISRDGGRLKKTQLFFIEHLNSWVDVVVKPQKLYVKPHICEYNGRLVIRYDSSENHSPVIEFLEELIKDKESMKIGFALEDKQINPSDKMIYEINMSGVGKIRTDLENKSKYLPTRLVFDLSERDSRKNRCYIRATSEEVAAKFLSRLKVEAASVLERAKVSPVEHVTSPGKGTIIIELDFNQLNRCAAKMAFNFACYHLGSDFVLNDDFNCIREYIHGSNVKESEIVMSKGGEWGLSMDNRYVMFLKQDSAASRLLPFLKNKHYIVLTSARFSGGAHLFAEVTMYGVKHFIHLGPLRVENPIRNTLPAIFVTPFEGGGDEVLDIHKMVDLRLGAAIPS